MCKIAKYIIMLIVVNVYYIDEKLHYRYYHHLKAPKMNSTFNRHFFSWNKGNPKLKIFRKVIVLIYRQIQS